MTHIFLFWPPHWLTSLKPESTAEYFVLIYRVVAAVWVLVMVGASLVVLAKRWMPKERRILFSALCLLGLGHAFTDIAFIDQPLNFRSVFSFLGVVLALWGLRTHALADAAKMRRAGDRREG